MFKVVQLHFIRHGQTDYNAEGIIQGQMESCLNEFGKKQAEYLKKNIEINENDLIVSSDLLRCRQTCEILFGSENSDKIHYTQLLRERHMGKYQGLKKNDLSDVLLNLKHIEKGESLEDLYQRIEYFLKFLLHKIFEKKNIEKIYIVTHSTFILYFYQKIYGEIPKSIPNNCCTCSYLAKIGNNNFDKIDLTRWNHKYEDIK